MGACLSLDQEELKARAHSQAIDKQLNSWAKEEQNVIKLLLLGKYMFVIQLTRPKCYLPYGVMGHKTLCHFFLSTISQMYLKTVTQFTHMNSKYNHYVGTSAPLLSDFFLVFR